MVEILYLIVFVTILNIITGFRKPNGILGCGLVGFSGNGKFNLELIRTLLWHNSQTRGKHATGIYTPTTGIIKNAVEAKDFFDLPPMQMIHEEDTLLMGHVRHATVGDIKDPESAHPWDLGDIVMMHNGTLKNYEQLAEQYGFDKKDWKVDSQVLGLALQENFKKGDYFRVLTEYYGAAAVVCYHKADDSLYVYRDTERTLFYGYINDEMYISSLDDILKIMGCKSVTAFEPYVVNKIKNGKILNKVKIKRKHLKRKNVVSKIVEKVSDIINYKFYANSKFMLNDSNFRGFAHNLMDAKYAEGYILESITRSSGVDNLPKLTPGNFYKVNSVIDKHKVRITDDTNTVKEAFIHMFNTSNFIPTAGTYGYIVGTLNNDLKKEELYEVVYHRFGDDCVYINDHNSGDVIKVMLTNFRKASESEVENKLGSLEDTCVIKDNVIHLPVQTLTSKESEKENTEDIKDSFTDYEEVDDEPIDDKDLKIAGLKQCITLVEEAITEIVMDTGNVTEDELLLSLCTLESFLVKTKLSMDSDYKYVINMNENSLVNI